VLKKITASLAFCWNAAVTDGWSKRTVPRKAPLINCMICPDDEPGIFFRVETAEGKIKNIGFVVHLHKQLREELQKLPDAE
jgi:hypothetical protein